MRSHRLSAGVTGGIHTLTSILAYIHTGVCWFAFGARPCQCAELARLWVETTRNFGGVEEGKQLQAALAKGLPQLVAERWNQQGQVAARSTDEQLDVQALSRPHETNASARSGGQALWVLNSLSAELSRQQLLKWVGARQRLTLRQLKSLVDQLHLKAVQIVQHGGDAIVSPTNE